ncbi:MAG TPA: GlsB/YeaQ/YmgE family stress response membrane protein [Phenylobacterium sp.]|jgi:uncharacterized membrane protein YeaQ/YmgE (transglycosylase-associated protein family)
MNGVGILGFILIGILAGWIAEKVMRRNHGLITNLAVGVVGALIGGFIAGSIGMAAYGLIGSLIVATLGAILLLFLISLISRRHV